MSPSKLEKNTSQIDEDMNLPCMKLLALVIPDEIKNDLIDVLITLECISGFNLQAIAGYSREHSRFSLVEQVEGYRNLFRVEVLFDEPDQQQILKAIKPVCSRVKARYWITQVEFQGHF